MDNAENKIIIDLAKGMGDVKSLDDSRFVVLPDGYKVHDLEKLLSKPSRKMGTVTMTDAASFIDYFKLHNMGSKIYGQVEPSKFLAVLNDHRNDEAGWGDHKLVYNCPLSKEWKEWQNFSGTPRNQIEFAEFMEAHVPDINGSKPEEPTGATMLEVATSFKAQKKVNFASGQRLDNGQVDFVFQEEVQGSAGAKGHIKVPERFYIAIPVFEGGSPYRIEAKLRYRLKDGALSMWFDLVRHHKVQEAAFMDIWAEIAKGTQTTIWRGMPDKA